MPGIQKLEHTHLQIPDLDKGIEFYTTFLGLEEYERRGDTAYLGIPPTSHYDLIDDNYDLALSENGSGLDHFAIRVSEDELQSNVASLERTETEFTRPTDFKPGILDRVRIVLPSGLVMELVVVEQTPDPDPVDVPGQTRHHIPSSIDHITVNSTDVESDATFLRDTLGFSISDVGRFDGQTWGMAFVRYGEHHHDIGMMGILDVDEASMHHLAWAVNDMVHMKEVLDLLEGSGGTVEYGPTRHVAGNNVSLYIFDPFENRLEFSTEMVSLDESTPTSFLDGDVDDLVTRWPGTFIGRDG